MNRIEIGSLALKLTAEDPRDAKRLAERVASGLDRLSLSGQSPANKELLRIRVDASPGMTRQHLADKIIAELMRQIGSK
jgi:hypothetical protein